MAHFSRTTVVRAERIFTGVEGQPLQSGAVTFSGSTIDAVQTDQELDLFHERTPDLNLHTYEDATIIPGLIDAHAHITLAGDGRTYEQMALDPDEMLALTCVHNMRKHLQCGVTTLRDNGGRNRVTFIVREAIRRGYISGPRLLLCGRPLTHSSGHFHWCNGEADGEVQIRKAVRVLIAEGADHIKIMASGGSTAGNLPYYASYTSRELRWAVEAAHDLGRLTTAHARSKSSMEYAVEAGLDCIEHAEFLVPGEMKRYGHGLTASGPVEYDTGLASRIIDSGMYISLTLQQGGYETLLRLRAKGSSLNAEERSQLDGLEERFDTKLRTMSRLLEGGARPRLVVSSDAGPYSTEFGRMHLGFELAIMGGLSPAQALHSMTSIAAAACGMQDRIGSLEPGKEADLVVVSGDPLTDPASLKKVLAVYQGGILVHSVSEPNGRISVQDKARP